MGRIRRSRRNVAEGAEKPYEHGDHLKVVRGGADIEYFDKYPNVAGSGSWERKEDGTLEP